MKRMTITLLVFLFGVSAFAMNNEPTSFRGINFGVSFKGYLSQFTHVADSDAISSYRRKNEDMKIGGVNLTDCLYFSTYGLFLGVMIETKGVGDADRLIAILDEKYGVGSQPNQFMPRNLVWQGARIEIESKYNQFSNELTVYYRHLPTVELMKQKNKNKAKTASGDDF